MFLEDLFHTTDDMAREGWAEANAGNITVRLTEEQLAELTPLRDDGPWLPLAIPVPTLAGECFLVTAKGCQIRNISHYPRRDCGVIRLSGDGTAYQIIWGLEGTVPTSEFFAHLLSHAVRKEKSGGAERVLLHTHPVTLVALCHRMAPDSKALTKLLWSMHPEGVCLFPGGVAFVPFAISGTEELSRLTCHAFETYSMVLWEYHGIFASGTTLDHAFGQVQAAEKCAKIYQAACTMGGVTRALDDAAIRAVADNFHLTTVEGVLDV